jgi:hypothetical protein
MILLKNVFRYPGPWSLLRCRTIRVRVRMVVIVVSKDRRWVMLVLMSVVMAMVRIMGKLLPLPSPSIVPCLTTP